MHFHVIGVFSFSLLPFLFANNSLVCVVPSSTTGICLWFQKTQIAWIAITLNLFRSSGFRIGIIYRFANLIFITTMHSIQYRKQLVGWGTTVSVKIYLSVNIHFSTLYSSTLHNYTITNTLIDFNYKIIVEFKNSHSVFMETQMLCKG